MTQDQHTGYTLILDKSHLAWVLSHVLSMHTDNQGRIVSSYGGATSNYEAIYLDLNNLQIWHTGFSPAKALLLQSGHAGETPPGHVTQVTSIWLWNRDEGALETPLTSSLFSYLKAKPREL